jgi:hypothetical protein
LFSFILYLYRSVRIPILAFFYIPCFCFKFNCLLSLGTPCLWNWSAFSVLRNYYFSRCFVWNVGRKYRCPNRGLSRLPSLHEHTKAGSVFTFGFYSTQQVVLTDACYLTTFPNRINLIVLNIRWLWMIDSKGREKRLSCRVPGPRLWPKHDKHFLYFAFCLLHHKPNFW